MNKWMYKIRDEMQKYIKQQTEAWTQEDKDLLANLLIEMIKSCLCR